MQEILQSDQRPKQNHKDAILPAHPKELYLLGKTWTIEAQKYSLSDYPVSKKLINLLRHGSPPREDDGAIEFWSSVIIGPTNSGRAAWQKEEETTKDFSIVLSLQEKFFASELFKVIQDAISLIRHCRTMSWFRTNYTRTFITLDVRSILHSIINSGLIPGGQNLSKRQTVFFCLWIPWTKNTRIPDKIDLEAPRFAQYMHKAWKKHQNTVFWVDINLALKKGLKFYQTRSNAIILHDTLPAYCIPKVVRMETEGVINERVYASPRPTPKIFFETWLDQSFGFRSCSTARRRSCSTSKKNPNQPNQTQIQIMKERGDPLFAQKALRSQEIETRSSREEDVNHDRTVKPVVCSQSERSMLNEVDIDFRISGLPHSVVKQAENYRVRELVKKIENHPHRQDLQRDLQQNNAYNPPSEKFKKMRKDMGHVELFELFETDPKTQCKECLLYWSQGIV